MKREENLENIGSEHRVKINTIIAKENSILNKSFNGTRKLEYLIIYAPMKQIKIRIVSQND